MEAWLAFVSVCKAAGHYIGDFIFFFIKNLLGSLRISYILTWGTVDYILTWGTFL